MERKSIFNIANRNSRYVNNNITKIEVKKPKDFIKVHSTSSIEKDISAINESDNLSVCKEKRKSTLIGN